MAGHFSNYQYFFEFIILSLYRIGGWNDDCFIDFDIAPKTILPENSRKPYYNCGFTCSVRIVGISAK